MGTLKIQMKKQFPSDKEVRKRHRERNLIAKHLKESGLYDLKVIKSKVKYKRKKLNPKNIERYLDNDDE